MSGLKWIRIDTALPRNHKIVQLLADNHHRAGLVYVFSLALAGEQGTDGRIPAALLPHIHSRKLDAQHLVDVGLWLPRPGGWDIKDWQEYQPSTEETSRRTAHARAAALVRWHPNDNGARTQ